jgi:glucose-1-phosphate thymidylyltransferase
MSDNVVGIIPAAGKGTRLAPFPCAKELFPIGFQDFLVKGQIEKRPKVVSQYIIEQMAEAGVGRLMIIVGPGKQDVVEYYGDGSRFGLQIGYLYQERLDGMPSAINLARPWIGDATVLFGMPDTIIRPSAALKALLADHEASGADLSLGLFPTDRPEKFGMVEISENGRVLSTIDKPKQTSLKYMWGACCWSGTFTELLDSFLSSHDSSGRETVLGDVFNEALSRKLNVRGVTLDDGRYIDIGTSDELNTALREFHAN